MNTNTNQAPAVTSSERGLSLLQAFRDAQRKYLMLAETNDPRRLHYADRAAALDKKLGGAKEAA